MDAAAATEAGEERDHVISNQVSEGTDTVGLSEKLNTDAVTGGENEEDVEKSPREGLSSVAAEETKVEEDDDEDDDDDDEEEIPAVADVCEESQTGDNGEKELKPADDENEDEASVSNVKISGGGDLDEMMDIGTVDQVEQEAQMKWSEEETSTDTVQSSEEGKTIKEEADDSLQSASSPSLGPEKNAAESQETTSNGMKVVKLSEEEIESESMQTSSQAEKSSSPVIVVKDEPEDDEYECCITSATPAVRRNPKSPRGRSFPRTCVM